MVEIDAITSHPALESLCPPGDFNQNQAYKLLATSDADVYISNLASPPTILTFNHRTSKSKLLIFSTPVDFQVSELLLNEPAKMLAVVGTNSLIVGIIPLFITSNTPTLDMQAMRIGSNYYMQDAFPIVQVKWHPLSATQSHLVVLSSNGVLRMFDISANIDEPEQTFYLCGSPTSFKSRMFSCDNGDMEAVSFDFGDTNAANWSCLTVFGLLKSGGVVSICPVLPDDSLLPENTVECLESATNAAMQMGNDNERVPLYWQMKYVQALKALANRDEANRYTRPQFKLGPARQGPYLLNLSSTLSEGGMDDYTDIKIVSCTLGLVALIASPRGLQISVLLDAIEPDWNVSDMDQLPMQKLLAVEDVILKSSGMIISDPLVKDIFLSDSKSVFQITIGAVAHIEQVAKTGKMPVDNNWQASIVRKLVDISEDREMCAGFRIVDDHRHDHAFICLTNQMKLICEQMVVTTTLKPRNLKFSNRASKSAPPGILTSVFNTIQTKLKPPALISKELYPLFVDANLDVISKEVSSTRDSIKLVYSLYNELEAHVELINDEMELQASARQMIQTRFQSLQARYGAIHKRIVSVQEKHELLQKRAGSLLDLVHEATTAHISAEEAQWFKSLETQSAHMAAMRTKLAKLTVDDRLERKRVSSEMLGTSQLQSIKQEIAREHQELSKAIHLFRSLQIED